MKNFYELLKEIGVELPEDKKADFDKEFAANYKTIAEVSKITAARDNYKSQLETAQNSLREFEGVDVKDLQGKIAQLTTDLSAKETEYQAKIADMNFFDLLKNTAIAAGAHDVKAVEPFLDVNALKASKNQSEDVKTAINAVKAERNYLFKSNEPINNPVRDTGNPSGGSEVFDIMRAAMGLPAKDKN